MSTDVLGSMSIMKFSFDQIRSSAEKELVRVLEEDFGLAQYYDIFDNKEDLEAITQKMLTNAVLLNKYIAPRIYSICADVQERLGFHEQIDFYVMSTPEVNAFSINGYGFVPHIVCLHSALIQLFTDDELRYVIGHEIGHIIYKHDKLDIAQKFIFKNEDDRPPAGFTINYFRLVKNAEINADRIGFLAIPDINIVTYAIFKLHYGLPAESMNFQAEEYLKQLDRIKELGLGDLFSSHPNPMIRLQALIDFSNSALSPLDNAKNISAEELEKRLAELMLMLEIKPKNEKEKHIVEFLSAAGMYLIYDQDAYEQKWDALYDMISDFSTQPEKYLNFANPEEVKQQLEPICKYYAERQDDTKFDLVKRVVLLTLMDGRLEAEEKKRLSEIGTMINIAPDTLNLIIRQMSESYLNPNNKVHASKLT